jgi:hypothetical protein
MAGRGPAPKGTRSRERDKDPVLAVEPDGETHGPELSESFEWPPATLTWWNTWRNSAQAQTFTDTDWSFLLDTAVLHAEFWLGNRALAAELRLRAAKFGATPEDRARLRLEVGTPPAPTSKPTGLQAKSATDRKQRLLRAVGDGGA